MEALLFHRNRKKAASMPNKAIKDLTRMMMPPQFFSDDKRQVLLQKIEELSGLEKSRYDSLCAVILDNLVNYCQNLPEASNSYYSQSGGLVDYALNRTEAALSLFKEFLVLDPSNQLTEEQKLWQYALYSAALLQGIGKLFVDYHVQIFDSNGYLLKDWNPLLESLVSIGQFYHYEFQKESDLEFRRRLNLLLARTLMPSSGFTWIASNPQVLAVWLALLNEDHRSAGTLGAILIRADAIAIQRYFNEFLVKTSTSRHGRGRPGTFTGGSPEALIEREQATGAEFLKWMTKALDEGRIMINKAPLFMVPGGMLMCQEMFQLFIREHPEYKNWQAIQNGFLSLGLHRRSADGSEISRFEQEHNQQMYSGVVFSKYGVVLPNSVQVHNLSNGKTESMSATDLVHRAQYSSQFLEHSHVVAIAPLQKLAGTGQWLNIDSESPGLQLGASRSG
jgi:integrating conjugative element relaxase (TIGR03760 family)